MKTKKALIFFITEVCCLAIIGYILLGPAIFQFNSTAIFFTVFGITAILLFTVLEFWNIREFIYLGLLVSLFIIYIWSRNNSFFVIIRNSLWFITIGFFTWLSHNIIKSRNPQRLRIIPLVVWIISFNCIYILMLVFNLYIFRFYTLSENFTFVFYLIHALRYGTVIGVSIGLGYLLADFIIKNLKILKE